MSSASPTAPITFLFTDIEGSSRLWEAEPERMAQALARHDGLARSAVEAHGGRVIKMIGDGLHAAFADPLDALRAVVQLQLALADPAATAGVALRVRCGLHAGAVERRDNDYFGSTVNRAARVMSAAHGGQMLLSQAVVEAIHARLPEGVTLRDLGAVRLRDLSRAEHVYQVLHPALRQEFPALRSLEATPNNLPQQVTSFVGREGGLTEVRQLLATTPLLTLLGMGGLGKTRLSLQLAADVLDDYPDGVWFIELAAIADARLVPQAVASVLGVMEEAGRPVVEALVKYVRDRQLLVILDNCEHLLGACAELAKQLLQSGARMKLLASSREHLQVPGERTYPVPALALPDPQHPPSVDALLGFEAVRLFVDRAQAVQPGFQLSAANAPALAEICQRLDGIPLAIELAAARVRSLAVDKIAERLSDRFRLLTGGDRTALPRQQTLRALIDWSYDLLEPAEQTLFERLSVFAGGCTVEAAEAVGAGGAIDPAEVLDLLSALVDKSLVELVAGGERYRMLETVRQYAQEHLQGGDDEANVRDRHLGHYLALAEDAARGMREGAAGPKWLERLDIEHGNLQAALAWGLRPSGNPDAAMRLCWALYTYWLRRGLSREGRTWCTAALEKEAGTGDKLARARVLLVAAGMTEGHGDARARCEQALSLSREVGDRHLEARALNLLSIIHVDRMELAEAQALLEQAIEIGRELGDRKMEVTHAGNLGLMLVHQGKFAPARVLLERELALSRELGERYNEASAYRHLGLLAYGEEDYSAAQLLHERALAIYRELRVPAGEMEQHRNLAEAAVARDDLVAARGHFAQALTMHREISYPASAADCFDGMVGLAVKSRAFAMGAQFSGVADALRESVGVLAMPSDARRHRANRERCREGLEDPAYDDAVSAGRARALAASIDDALSWLQANAR